MHALGKNTVHKGVATISIFRHPLVVLEYVPLGRKEDCCGVLADVGKLRRDCVVEGWALIQ